MRGPEDESVSQVSEEAAAAAPRGARAPAEAVARPPGGKALLRLLDLLEVRGLDQTAADVVERAVAPADRAALNTIAAQRGLTIPASTGPRRKASSAPAGARGGAGASDDTAPAETQQYAAESAATARELTSGAADRPRARGAAL